MRVRSVVLVGCFFIAACDIQSSAPQNESAGQEREALVSYTSITTSGAAINSGPVVAAQQTSGCWACSAVWGNLSASSSLGYERMWYAYEGFTTWLVDNNVHESFVGRPAAVSIPGNCDTTFVQRRTGPLGYSPRHLDLEGGWLG